MKDHRMHSKELLIGAALGGIIGGIAALLTAPQSGQKLRRGLCETCDDLSDSAHDLANQFSKKGKEWKNRAQIMAERVKGGFHREEEEEHLKDVLIGGVAGAIIGVVGGLLLAPKPGNDLPHDLSEACRNMSDKSHEIVEEVSDQGRVFVDKARSRVNTWLDLARNLIEEVTDEVEEKREELSEKAEHCVHNHHFDDVAEWASLGLLLWKKLKSRR